MRCNVPLHFFLEKRYILKSSFSLGLNSQLALFSISVYDTAIFWAKQKQKVHLHSSLSTTLLFLRSWVTIRPIYSSSSLPLFLGGGATFVPKKVIAPSSLPFPPKRPESVPQPPQNPDSFQRKRRRELKVEIPLGGGPLWRKIGRRRREENGLGLVYSFPRFLPTSTRE